MFRLLGVYNFEAAFKTTFIKPDFLWNVNVQIATVCEAEVEAEANIIITNVGHTCRDCGVFTSEDEAEAVAVAFGHQIYQNV